MKTLTGCVTSLTLTVAGIFCVASVQGQSLHTPTRYDRFIPTRGAPPEAPARLLPTDTTKPGKTGYDFKTNGYARQGPEFDKITEDNVDPLGSYNEARFVFEEVERQDDGVGPVYNAQSCRECHQNVVTGGASQVLVQRTGHTENGIFYESLGGSLIQSRATYPDIVEHVVDTDETRAFRISPAGLGDGYVECIADSTLLAIRDGQPPDKQGLAPEVPVLEGDGSARIGRFGWKAQHASLVSFAADAYVNEMGITSPLFPDENTSSGKYVGYGTEYDPVPDPEDDGTDVEAFALFLRSTTAPARGQITNDVRLGENRFNQVGCAVCHVSSIVTAPAGTPINGGAFAVPNALGDRLIHPYSDFLLHDVGTGDGIPILPLPDYADTANKMKTAPLWGLRTRNRLMHDGLSSTLYDAIERHAGQAADSVAQFNALTDDDKALVYAFLNSL